MAVRFSEENVRCMGRNARGVRGITLRDGDIVCGVTMVDESKKLLTVTEKGYGKRVEFDDFRQMRSRGGFGVTCHNISEKTGLLTGIMTVCEDDDLMMITDEGMVVRTHISEIPVYSRSASGVIVMRTQNDQKLVNFTVIENSEEESLPEERTEAAEVTESVEVTEDDTTNA
jgi:DNA gyrase subunit A